MAQRWTEAAKKRIYDSRVEGTRNLVNALSAQSQRPRVLVCASAVGYYGSRGDQILTETSSAGQRLPGARGGGLGRGGSIWRRRWGSEWSVCASAWCWDMAARWPNCFLSFRFGVGGRLGSGRQWMAWIHLEDAVNLILFALDYAAIRGAVNATAPHPVTNEEFTGRLALELHRPAILPVPAFALKLALGEMSEMVLASQRVLPTLAKSAGFRFQYPEIQAALANLLVRLEPERQ